MNANVSKFLRHPAVAPAIVGAVCFGVGYYLGKQNRIVGRTIPEEDFYEEEEYYEEQEDFDIPEPVDVEVRVKPAVDTQVETMVNEDGDGLTVFSSPAEVWEWETEMAGRTTIEPYVLHKDEFYGEENDNYTQTSLVYYAGDDILVDQDERPIYNYLNVVGPLRFGHGSDQNDVFYVRNDKMKAEYEITYDEGLYSVVVLGLEIEENERVKGLKHSVPRFRME